MTVIRQKVEAIKRILIRGLVEKLIKDRTINSSEAIRIILSIETYKMLMNNETRLWTNSVEMIYDVLTSEIDGDKKRFEWLLSPDI